jgi:UDP-glucose 4-epimerase
VRVLITGSSGQIGTNLGLALLAAGHEVHGIDKRANAWTDEVPTEIVDLVDVARTGSVWSPPWQPDCIIHLAAWAKVHQLVLEPTNVEMSMAALEIARAVDAPIIFGSSREVYGDIHRHVTDEGTADFVVAESPYSASKIAGEAFFYSYSRCYGIPHLVFRFSNVYGRFDNDEDRMERVIPLFVRKLAHAEPVVVYGKQKIFDFTYVDDCVRGVMAGIEALVDRKVVNETINLAYGQGSTLFDLINLLRLALGVEPEVSYEPSRPGEIARYVADISKARRLLDYEPEVPLTLGIQLYVEWCRSQGFI